jgi:hypothetical protein
MLKINFLKYKNYLNAFSNQNYFEKQLFYFSVFLNCFNILISKINFKILNNILF